MIPSEKGHKHTAPRNHYLLVSANSDCFLKYKDYNFAKKNHSSCFTIDLRAEVSCEKTSLRPNRRNPGRVLGKRRKCVVKA